MIDITWCQSYQWVTPGGLICEEMFVVSNWLTCSCLTCLELSLDLWARVATGDWPGSHEAEASGGLGWGRPGHHKTTRQQPASQPLNTQTSRWRPTPANTIRSSDSQAGRLEEKMRTVRISSPGLAWLSQARRPQLWAQPRDIDWGVDWSRGEWSGVSAATSAHTSQTSVQPVLWADWDSRGNNNNNNILSYQHNI